MFRIERKAAGDQPISTWYLPVGEYIVGRGPKSNINLGKNNTISRQHATLRVTKGNFNPSDPQTLHQVELHDGVYKQDTSTWKASASGTFVNNVPLVTDWVNCNL